MKKRLVPVLAAVLFLFTGSAMAAETAGGEPEHASAVQSPSPFVSDFPIVPSPIPPMPDTPFAPEFPRPAPPAPGIDSPFIPAWLYDQSGT